MRQPTWARRSLGGLRRRAASSGASFVAVCLAVSCGLSPVDDLPSAVDGLTVDGSSDSPSLDIGVGAGGSSASGGSPGNCASTLRYECRGAELWQAGLTSSCVYQALQLDIVCTRCVDEPNDGAAHCLGWGGAGGEGGEGGAAADTSVDDGVP